MVIDRGAGEKHPYMTKDMSRIILKLLVLKRMQKKDVYSYALIKEFSGTHIIHFIKVHGGSVKNDIYNTVNALEKSGYISTKAAIVEGRLKKYYKITARGKERSQGVKAAFPKEHEGIDGNNKMMNDTMKEIIEIPQPFREVRRLWGT